MADTMYTLDVRLRDISPPIWRAIEIAGSATLEDLHFAIQVAMGWTNSHLHQFVIGDASYGMVDVDDADELDLEDEGEFELQDLVKHGESFLYEYDFGDSWEHDTKVEAVLDADDDKTYPACIAGERACPPEDCGGAWGYEELLAALADPDHDEHDQFLEWVGGEFDPARLDLTAINRALAPASRRRTPTHAR